MLSVDLHYLLEKAFSDGFTNDNLSNVTGVSIDLINRVDEKKLTQEDIKQLNSLLCFLSQIYLEDGKTFDRLILHLRREERRFFAAPSSAFSFCLYPCLLPVRTG